MPKPLFSLYPGYYGDSISLSINSSASSAQIRYTLNGDEPTVNSPLYSTPLKLKNRSHLKNNISTIPTNPSFSYPKPGYDTSRADSRGWLLPFDTVFKATVVKAKLFKTGYTSDSTSVATYLIMDNISSVFSLPVMSISLDSTDLFSYASGIYVYGADSVHEGNYSNDVEKKAFIEFFEVSGQRVVAQFANIKIHGNGGRHAPQKSLQLKAEKEFGKGNFEHQFFKESQIKKFDRLLLRNSGHRPDCMPRDDAAQEFLKSLENISQHNRQCIVLINGEYWGIQTIKEILDDNYFYRTYNIPKNDCIILTQAGSLDEGFPGDENAYSDLLNFFSLNSMASSLNYNYVNSQMDLQSFMDFECGEIFLGNGDWPNNNTKFWRYRRNFNDRSLNNHLDGRWRWMFYDMDASFGGDCSGIYPSHNSLTRATDPAYNKYTRPLRSLLVNEQFKMEFINRYADLLNSDFLSFQLAAAINKTTASYNPEMQGHVERWHYPSIATTLSTRSAEIPGTVQWNTIKSGLLNFTGLRASKTRRHFMTYFSLIDTVKVTINVNDTLMGKVKINSLYLDSYLTKNTGAVYPWNGIYFNGNPIQLEAIAYPGYKFSHWNLIADTINHFTKNVTSDTLIIANFMVDTAFRAKNYLYINEVLASNTRNIKDESFENEDWIELYNPNNFGIDLSDFYLSDESTNRRKFKIKGTGKQTIIQPKSFMLIWMDDDTLQGKLHANFKLNATGDSVFLTLPNGVQTVDSIGFKNLESNKAYGREIDGDSNWIIFDVPTPNASNKIMEIPELDYFLVYPNPTSDYLFFTQSKNVEVFDILGRKLLSFPNIKSIDVRDLAQGIYILKTDTGEVFKFKKS
ncbi:MAG: CotH kinase family protein [Bacteroidota bacterium]